MAYRILPRIRGGAQALNLSTNLELKAEPMVFRPGVGYFVLLAESDNTPNNEFNAPNRGDFTMRRLMLVAAAAAIALVGLSANTCGEQQQSQPEQQTQPEQQPTPPEQPEQPQ